MDRDRWWWWPGTINGIKSAPPCASFVGVFFFFFIFPQVDSHSARRLLRVPPRRHLGHAPPVVVVVVADGIVDLGGRAGAGEGTVRPRPRSRSRAYWRWRGWFPLFRSTLQTLVHIGGHVAAGTGPSPSPSPSPRGSTRRREGQITRNESRQSTRRTRSCPPVRPSRHHYSIPTHTTHTTTHTTHTTHIATRRARWGRQVRIFVHILVNDTDSIRMRF